MMAAQPTMDLSADVHADLMDKLTQISHALAYAADDLTHAQFS